MAFLVLPGRGKSKAAGNTTTTTTNTSTPVELFSANSFTDLEVAADRSLEDLFEGDEPDFSNSLVDMESGAPNTDFDNEFMLFDFRDDAGLLRDNLFNVLPVRADSTLGQLALTTESTTPMSTVQAPVVVADNSTAAFTNCAPIQQTLPTPAPDPLASTTGTPVKRPRGRPPGKSTPREPLEYRCRYGCKRGSMNGVSLRKHMMRVHGIFSSAHKNIKKCGFCERTYDPKIKDLICNKAGSFCPQLSDAERRNMNVQPPRDEQEEADTFAYDHSGPDRQGPSALVIVRPGDDEDERHAACAAAIENWRPAAPGRVQVKDGLITPDETPFKSSASAPIDRIAVDEINPASALPAHEGNGKKRVAQEEPLQVLAAPKRAMHEMPLFAPLPSYDSLQAVAGAARSDTGFVEENNGPWAPTFDNMAMLTPPLYYNGLQAAAHPAPNEIGLVEENNRNGTLIFDNQMPYNSGSKENVDLGDLIASLTDQHEHDFDVNLLDDVTGFN